MSLSDLVQLRWQQIRAVENQVATDLTLVGLRKENALLKENLVESSKYQENYEDLKEKLKNYILRTKSFAGKFRMELDQTRGLCTIQSNQISVLNRSIAENITRLEQTYRKNNASSTELQAEIDKLSKELADSRKQIKLYQKENASLSESNAKLQGTLNECELTKIKLSNDYSALHDLHDDLVQKNEKRLKEYSVVCEKNQVEIAQLKEKIAKLEAFGGEALSAALEAQKQALEDKDKVIFELRRENEDHKINILNLKLHIERLTSAMMGNKTHFAKFMELKTENAILHNQINSLQSTNTEKLDVLFPGSQNPKRGGIPDVSKAALAEVDPSLVEFQESINSYLKSNTGKLTGREGAPPPMFPKVHNPRPSQFSGAPPSFDVDDGGFLKSGPVAAAPLNPLPGKGRGRHPGPMRSGSSH